MRYPLLAAGLVGFVGFVTVALLAPPASAAEGDACTADVDCGDGYACNLPPTFGGGTSGTDASNPSLPSGTAGAPTTDPGSPPAVGGAPVEQPPPSGSCYKAPRPCTTDADCGEHYACVLQESPSFSVCDVDGNCTAPAADPPATSECEAVPIPCAADADCPEASICTDQLCNFAPTACLDDAACPANYQCIISESEECSVGPCAAGQPCDTEPVCVTTSTEGFCFPAPQPCTSDADCSGSWTCYDVTFDGAPPQWDGVDLACLPGGIVGALEGYVAVDGELGSDSSSTADGAPVVGGDSGEVELGRAGAGGASPPVAEGDAKGVGEDEGRCTVAAPGAVGSAAGSWLLIAAGLVASRWRARRRAA